MRTRYRSSSSDAGILAGLGCTFWLAIVGLNLTVGAWCLQYVVGYWTNYFTHVAKHVPFWLAAVASLVVEFTIPAAILTKLVSYIL